jgi:ATP-binding cassette subfamily A (ABC1) protein 3
MAFLRQTWTLVDKNLTIVLYRNWLGTLVRAFIAPVIFFFFISYAKNFFVPPSDFGVGSPSPLRSFSDALTLSAGGRNTVVFVDNGHTGGQISDVISQLSRTVEAQGKSAQVVGSDVDLLSICKSSIRGTTPCFAAASFHSSPTEGGLWNYTIRADGSFGERIYVYSNTNDADIYALPFQHAIDNAIGSSNGKSLPDNIQQYAYTSQTNEQRDRNITRLYMGVKSLLHPKSVCFDSNEISELN